MNLPQIRLPHDIMQKVKEKNVRHTLNGLKHLNKKKNGFDLKTYNINKDRELEFITCLVIVSVTLFIFQEFKK